MKKLTSPVPVQRQFPAFACHLSYILTCVLTTSSFFYSFFFYSVCVCVCVCVRACVRACVCSARLVSLSAGAAWRCVCVGRGGGGGGEDQKEEGGEGGWMLEVSAKGEGRG